MKQKFLITFTLALLSMIGIAVGQSPQMGPHPVPVPVEPSLFNIILYILVPLAAVIFYYYYRKKKRKERDKQ